MKKIFLLYMFTSFGMGIFGQPIIQSSEYYPSIGDSYKVFNAFFMPPGSAGNNVTWDLSGLNLYSSYTVNIIGPNSNFPTATHVIRQVGGSNLFLDLSSDDYLIVGLDHSFGNIDYTDPNKLYQFPMTMGTTFTNSFFGIMIQEGDTIMRTGTTEVEVDGYGTLITPLGTYTDVLRVHNLRTIIDDLHGTITNTIDDMYTWIKAGTHHELANIQTIDMDGDTLNAAYYIDGTTSGLTNSAIINSLVLFPNPARDIVSLKSNLIIDKIEVFDLNERIIDLAFDPTNKTIDVSKLNSGIYYVYVYTNNNKSIQKLVKE